MAVIFNFIFSLVSLSINFLVDEPELASVAPEPKPEPEPEPESEPELEL